MKIEDLRIQLGHNGTPDNGNFYALKEIINNPDKTALKYPFLKDGIVKYEELTFKQFKNEALKIAGGLNNKNFKTGDRIIILFPVSVDLYLTIFACFYLGIIPIFLDISMGQKQLVKAIRSSKAKGVISIDKLLKYKLLIPALWGKECFSLDRKRFLVPKFSEIKESDVFEGQEVSLSSELPALITFTSGTSGVPKGANRTIQILLNQKIVSEYLWPHKHNEVDMPAFPMIVLQNLGCGVSSILPMIDFQNYKGMDPKVIVEQMITEKITRFSAQPFFIEKITDYLLKEKLKVESIRSLVVGGAVVSKKLCEKIIKAFPDVDCNIVYGSTEAEPIAHTKMNEFIETEGRGLLLGKITSVLESKIIKVSDNPSVEDETEKGSVGEIILAGPHVIEEYIDNHPANEILKLRSSENVVWHRTGDLGYLDENDYLWLVGRITDQIEGCDGLIPCYDLEEELLTLTGFKAAFINSNKILFVESLFDDDLNGKVLEFLQIKKLGKFEVQFIESIPVDQRHFSRVDRGKLRTHYHKI
jgi:acyl-CoA synthetase (AMP-forming)/AMP-acid ligase II